MLYPTEIDHLGLAGLDSAARLASDLGAPLSMLHVVRLPRVVELIAPEPVPLKNHPEWTAHVVAARKRLDAACGRDGICVDIDTHIVQSSYLDRAIASVAEAIGADLIAMPSHGRSVLPRFLLGSVAERVVRRAPAPVYVFRP